MKRRDILKPSFSINIDVNNLYISLYIFVVFHYLPNCAKIYNILMDNINNNIYTISSRVTALASYADVK